MAKGDNDHWMAAAFGNAHGQFKANAKKHGESTKAFAADVTKKGSTASTHVKRQAQLVKNAHPGR